MPGPPMNNSGLAKLQTESTESVRNGEGQQLRQNAPVPEAREITQTDRLNKRLLESLLERMNKSEEQFDKFMDKSEEESDSEDCDEERNQF